MICGLVAVVAAVLVAGCTGAELRAAPPIDDSTSQARARGGCAAQRIGEARCMIVTVRAAAGPDVAGWAPADFQARYKLPSSTKGAGTIVAIVEAYDNPNVASDLGQYRTQFGLGIADFTKYNQRGEQKNYPAGNTAWGVDIDLAVEMVSAACPLCTIYLVEADSNYGNDLSKSTREAVKLGAHIISIAWGCNTAACLDKRVFAHRRVTYVAAAGDAGFGAGEPATFDTVAAIGGTNLSKVSSQYSESIWSSAGGCAIGIKKPRWQHDSYCNGRIANDAAAVAEGVAFYDTYGGYGWGEVSGTSVSAPLIAGIFGLAGNASRQDGGRTFWMRKHHRDLYTPAGRCSSAYSYGQYNECVGWGTPDGIGAF